MTVLVGTVTDDARSFFPRFFGRIYGISETTTNVVTPKWNSLIRKFKVGEGGWEDLGAGKVPRTPDPSLRRLSSPLIQDLDAIVDTTRPLIDQRYSSETTATFEKDLEDGDFTAISNGIEISCLLELTDFNDDGDGNNPSLFEIGIFCDHPEIAGEDLMIAYCTFPEQIKTSAVQLLNKVRIIF